MDQPKMGKNQQRWTTGSACVAAVLLCTALFMLLHSLGSAVPTPPPLQQSPARALSAPRGGAAAPGAPGASAPAPPHATHPHRSTPPQDRPRRLLPPLEQTLPPPLRNCSAKPAAVGGPRAVVVAAPRAVDVDPAAVAAWSAQTAAACAGLKADVVVLTPQAQLAVQGLASPGSAGARLWALLRRLLTCSEHGGPDRWVKLGAWFLAASVAGMGYAKLCVIAADTVALRPLGPEDPCWRDAAVADVPHGGAVHPPFYRAPPVWDCGAELARRGQAVGVWIALRRQLEDVVYPGRYLPPSECAPWSEGLCACPPRGGPPRYRALPLGLASPGAAARRAAARRATAQRPADAARMLVFVLASVAVWDRVLLIRAVWGRQLALLGTEACRAAHGCLGFALPQQECDEVALLDPSGRTALVPVNTSAARDSWGNMWEKARLTWIAVAELPGFQWFVKVDTDSWVGVGNMHALLRWYDPAGPHYLGHVSLHRWPNDNLALNTGSGYVLSRGALQRVVPLLRSLPQIKGRGQHQCSHRKDGAEDAALSQCLREVRVIPRDTMDAAGRHRFNCFSWTTHRYMARTVWYNAWYWDYQPPDAAEDSMATAAFPVIFHNIKGKYARKHFRELDERYGCPLGNASCISEPPSQGPFRYDAGLARAFGVDRSRNSRKACRRLPAAQCTPLAEGEQADPLPEADPEGAESPELARVVRVGLCANPTRDISEFARVLLPVVLSQQRIEYVSCSRDGLPLDGSPLPDILMCLGYFYNRSILVQPRLDRLAAARSGTGPRVPAPRPGWQEHTFWPPDLRWLVPHRGRPFLIAFAFEPFDQKHASNAGRFDVLLQCCRDSDGMGGAPQVHLPYSALTSISRQSGGRELLSAATSPSVAELRRRHFGLFLVSMCMNKAYQGEAMVRVAFYDELREALPAGLALHSGGDCRRNRRLHLQGRGAGWTAAQVELMRGYRWVFAMENTRKIGWVSERVPNAAAAGAIPIVFGAPDIDRFFNPARFVVLNLTDRQVDYVRGVCCQWFPARRNCDNPQHQRFPDGAAYDEAVAGAAAGIRAALREPFRELVRRILAIEGDDVQLRHIVAQPLLHANSNEGHVTSLGAQARQLRNVLQAYRSETLDPPS